MLIGMDNGNRYVKFDSYPGYSPVWVNPDHVMFATTTGDDDGNNITMLRLTGPAAQSVTVYGNAEDVLKALRYNRSAAPAV